MHPRRLVAVAVSLLALVVPGAASAANIKVTTTADERTPGVNNGCSLREAVSAANDNGTGPGGDCTAGEGHGVVDTITLPASATPYKLTDVGVDDDNADGDLDVFSSITFAGAGQTKTVIDGNLKDRVFDISNGTIEMRDLTIRNGRAPDGSPGLPGPDAAAGADSTGGDGGDGASGGGIRLVGNLTLTRVTMSGNAAGNGGAGGDAGPGGNATAGNGGAAHGGAGGAGGSGGAIALLGGHLSIIDSTLTANSAGLGGTGGVGGTGGNGANGTAGGVGGAGDGGNGGAGGAGGALFQNGNALTVTRSKLIDNLAGAGGAGGEGGNGGNGGTGTTSFGGDGGSATGGQGGSGGAGGGIDQENGSATIEDSLVRGGTAGAGGRGGNGGVGGDAETGSDAGQGGYSIGNNGGAGGDGGDWHGAGAVTQAAGSTFSLGVAGHGGAGGDGGPAGASPGSAGSSYAGGGHPGGRGGGLSLGGAASPQLANVTISGNRAGTGGGAGTFDMSGTGADAFGGVGGNGGGAFLGSAGSVVLTHATIAGNSLGVGGSGFAPVADGQGGALFANSSAGVTVQNSILAGNGSSQCGGSPAFAGHNLEFPDDLSCNGDLHSDPKLSSLGDHGGPTPTMLPAAGSPALDVAGTGPPCTAFDQRGVSRPKGVACDLGAVERSVPAATTGAASGITATKAAVAGTANPGELTTTYRFQFGKTTAYGSQTPAASAGSGPDPVAAHATITGLAPGTTYHYRLVVTNPDGTATGVDRTFKTALPPPSFAGAAIVSKSAKVKKGAARIKVACPRAAVTGCRGSLTLTAKGKRVGKASFAIASGRTVGVKVKLSKKARKVLRSKKKLKTKAKTSAVDARGGKAVVRTGKVTLKLPAG